MSGILLFAAVLSAGAAFIYHDARRKRPALISGAVAVAAGLAYGIHAATGGGL